MKRGASIAALGLMMLGACGDGLSDPSESSAPIQTSARSYEFVRDTVVILGDSFPRLGAEIPYTYANPTNRPIYIVQCRVPPAFVQRWSESGAWEPWRMKTPVTSWPACFNRKAETLESIPPDMAQSTRLIGCEG